MQKPSAGRRIIVHKKRNPRPVADDDWKKYWPPKTLPDCPACGGEVYVSNKGVRVGSEFFHCKGCDTQIPIGWIDQSGSRSESVDLMLKWNQNLVFKLEQEDSEMAKKTVSKAKSAKKSGRFVGKTTGKSVSETWLTAFSKARSQKLTDEQISRFMRSEFPQSKSAIYEVSGVRRVRGIYNAGGLTGQNDKAPTELCAFAKDGKPIAKFSKTNGAVPKVAKKSAASVPGKRRVVVRKKA